MSGPDPRTVLVTGGSGFLGSSVVRGLAAAGQHPDLVRVEPDGRALLVADTERITLEGWRSPVEARRKVIVVDRFDTAEPEAAASLLKTIEEPPVTTTFVLLAEEVPAEHVTIASRCFRVDFPPLADEVVAAAMVADGMDAERAAVLAEAAAGSIHRARLLAEAGQLDGFGCAVGTGAGEHRHAAGSALYHPPDHLDVFLHFQGGGLTRGTDCH